MTLSISIVACFERTTMLARPSLAHVSVAASWWVRFFLLATLTAVCESHAAELLPPIADVRAVCRHGQTFVTWKDVATGEEGAKYRYAVYRSARPIGADLANADRCLTGVLNNSAKLFGAAFSAAQRIDPTKPTMILEKGGQPLPLWSGLGVVTVRKNASSYFAVVACDEKGVVLSQPGATSTAIEEVIAPTQPIKLFDSKSRGQYSPQTSITGQTGLPLRVELHASQGQGGGAGEYGDYYLYFATPEMGYRDGLPGVFSVEERREKNGNYLLLRGREAIEHPSGTRAMETYWFGYYCIPQFASHAEPRAYPFTERRQEWIVDWVTKKYVADPLRITASGGSMGAWGSATYAFRHPERYAAVFPNRPRTRQRGLPSFLGALPKDARPLMDDGVTEYFSRMDMVRFATEHAADLPFFGWCCGRRDGFATWQEQVDMVKALAETRHGFAFAWNNGDHSSGAQPMSQITKYYPPELFAKNRSYPAFRRSSLDQNPGDGDPALGDLEGGINLGFRWSDLTDNARQWSVQLSNDLATDEMTVDVTPRRCQQFRLKPGTEVRWESSVGQSGKLTADAAGLVTISQLRLRAGETTRVTFNVP